MSAAAPLDNTRISERTKECAHFGKDHAKKPRWEKQAEKARKDAFFPSHVRNCANNPQRQGRWTLAVWKKGSPRSHTRIAYTCGSYRCPSVECQRAAAHRDFAKIKEAVDSVSESDGWVLQVLTIDQNETLEKRKAGSGWKNEQEAFRELSRMSRNYLARLRRWHKRMGWPDFGNRWVATVEVQRNGWPHLNLMLHSPGLAAWLVEQDAPDGRLVGELLEHVQASDWGGVGYASPAESRDALAGYIVKLAGDFGRKVGEIAKLTQAPTNARMKLRRIRAGKGFIRQLPRNPEYTGIMLRRQNKWGTPGVEPLMTPEQVKCPPEELDNYLLGVREAIKAEAEQMKDDARVGAEKRLVRKRSGGGIVLQFPRKETTYQPLEVQSAGKVIALVKERESSAMKKFELSVVASRLVLGVYDAENKKQAMQKFARASGYSCWADLLSRNPDCRESDLEVRDVTYKDFVRVRAHDDQ